ncbi:MAG: hypothetical protein KME25_00325 [Symplocastrum torsivum CPER-KK1]|uniref:Uncharacterized protein n=1 Tax=Symplocastrum torsivum CPER-KK1 TaxID=450513 RepID=A0A951PFM7_9CYAN|nr:hypothetical protein [Symplocastrum torsivum CPER-KK1]
MTNTVEAIAVPIKMRHLQLLFWRHLSFNAVRSLLLNFSPTYTPFAMSVFGMYVLEVI